MKEDKENNYWLSFLLGFIIGATFFTGFVLISNFNHSVIKDSTLNNVCNIVYGNNTIYVKQNSGNILCEYKKEIELKDGMIIK